MQNLGNIADSVTGGGKGTVPVKGTVVLMRKNVLDLNDSSASVIDNVGELLGQQVALQLVSATVGDPNNKNRGLVGTPAYLENCITSLPSLAAGDLKYNVTFQWDDKTGTPGAVIVKNHHNIEFYLKTVTIENFPGKGRIHFICNSWVYPVEKYNYDRIFFTNNTYFRANTPAPLLPYRDDELYHLRGHNVTGELQEWDRVYDYAYYNDLGDPDKSPELARPVLGGSAEYPYPRRGKTGRPPTKTDPNSESRLPLSLNIYVPRDERVGHVRMADFLADALKAVAESILPLLEPDSKATPLEFDSFDDVLKLYDDGGIPMLKEFLPAEGGLQPLVKLPRPQVIQADEWAWRTDEEFTRQMLAGVNPVIIKRLEVFPPVSKLDPRKYGNQNSTITAAHIQSNLDGLTVDQALKDNRLFILDYHDTLIPYVSRINSTKNKIYASRTLLFLHEDSTLKPLAIELSLPDPAGERHGAVSNVYTPSENGVDGAIWQLAKAYVTVNDTGVHQLISHWLNTHATMEPFVIATNRQLSVLHPIHKLLHPHYKGTMNINAVGREILINAEGTIERTVFPDRYAMEMSSFVYKGWNFTEETLPADLIRRGILVGDPEHPDKQQLLIKDYPYAVDGLAIWYAIKTWVSDYCAIYYPSDAAVRADAELQAWWREVREVGHGDKKDEPWWPEMQAVSELTHACTITIWVASALHAAVNFGQYPYAGYMPNGPTISRRFMPDPGSAEYDELKTDPDKAFLRTTTAVLETILVASVVKTLSTHASDENYLGQRDTPEWTADQSALQAFERFKAALAQIEEDIVRRNGDPSLKNRNGPVKIPYKLLYPTSEAGITAQGIPNSVSI